MQGSVAERLVALKQSKRPFPGIQLLRLYLSSNRADTYCEYYQGFRLLHDWLAPYDWSTVIPVLPDTGLGTYDIQELAKICCVSQSVIYGAILEIHYGRHIVERIIHDKIERVNRSKDKAAII